MKKLEASDRASGQGQRRVGPWNLVSAERFDMYLKMTNASVNSFSLVYNSDQLSNSMKVCNED